MTSARKFMMTRQRRVILEELRKLESHPTADEIYEMARRRLPRISLGTVYRNLEILSECGMIRKLELGGTQKRFDSMVRNHYHVRCLRCGCIEDVSMEPLTTIENAIRRVNDYEIIGFRLEFIGVCPQCKKEA
ncbi:MAG: transcriptional repressor [Syntrophobacterales bacterium]|nr:MAG: transcriptional repressor [Syntrophobacterales bacterium]